MTRPPEPPPSTRLHRPRYIRLFLPEREAVDIDHALCSSFCTHCLRVKNRGALADRASFDMFDLRPWFGNIMILDPVDGGADFRYRMYGSDIAAFSGFDMTGKRVSDFRGAVGAFVRDTYKHALDERALIYTQHSSVHSRYRCIWHRIICPVLKGDAPQIVACNYPVTSTSG